jgi:phosphatidylinositol-3-phosphatase
MLMCGVAAAKPARQYLLKHPKHERCAARYVKKAKVVKKRVHGRTVKVRETFCVFMAWKISAVQEPSTTAPTSPAQTASVVAQPPPLAPPAPTSSSTPTPPLPTPTQTSAGHVMVIVEENRDRDEVIGNPAMPFFNSLAAKYGQTTSWTGVSHPSLPNYLALISGSTQGQTEDATGVSFPGVETLGSQLAAAGISWKAYLEDLPTPAYEGAKSGEYVKEHNPFAYFPGTNGPNVVPGSEFASDLGSGKLPDFVWYTPNLVNDGHELSDTAVDASLKTLVEPLLASKWYGEAGVLIITWDESKAASGPNPIATIVVASAAEGKTLSLPGNHYGTLATIEDLYKLPLLGAAAGAQTLLPLLGAAP